MQVKATLVTLAFALSGFPDAFGATPANEGLTADQQTLALQIARLGALPRDQCLSQIQTDFVQHLPNYRSIYNTPPTAGATAAAPSELTTDENVVLEFAQNLICVRESTGDSKKPHLIAIGGAESSAARFPRVDFPYKELFPNRPKPGVPRIIVTPPQDNNPPAAVRNFANAARGATATTAATENVVTVGISVGAILAILPFLLLL